MAWRDFEVRDGVLRRYYGWDREVVVPNRVKVIGVSAFSENQYIEKVVLPEGVREIWGRAFSLCHNLKTLELPESLSVLETGVFSKSGLKSIRIPSRVTELPDLAFQDCDCLKSVTLPAGLKRIGREAFSGCMGLEELVLPAALESLGQDVFVVCDHLRRVILPDGAGQRNPKFLRSLSLKKRTHLEAPGLSLLQIPPKLRHSAILGLADWESRGNTLPPDLEADASEYLATEWPSFLSEAAKNLPLLRFLARRKVFSREAVEKLLDRAKGPDRAEAIALLMDYQRQLPQLDFARLEEEQLRELETGYWSPDRFDASWSFRRKKSGGLTLTDYHGLETDLFLPAGRGDEPVVALAEGLFRGNETIASVVIPEKAFCNCTALEQVRMEPEPESVRTAGFRTCPDRADIGIPDVGKRLGDSAFAGCGALTRLSLPEMLEEIGESVFTDCESLKELRIPAAVRTIHGAFLANIFLERLEVDPGNRWYRTEGPFLLSRDGTVLLKVFRLLQGEAAVPEGVEEIAPWAWENQQVTSVILPDSVKVIGEGAFYRCRQLESAVIGKGVEEIGESAFESCSALIALHVPGNVRKIERTAFFRCDLLASVTLEEGIESIGDSAFKECRALTDIRIPDSVTELGASAFAEARSLTSLTIGKGIRELPYGVLEGCRSLTSLTIPATVQYIRENFFGYWPENMEELRFLGIPESVEGELFPRKQVPARIRVPAQVPEGDFRDWLEKMAAEGASILYG